MTSQAQVTKLDLEEEYYLSGTNTWVNSIMKHPVVYKNVLSLWVAQHGYHGW